jgi:hypothetical protein
MLKLFAAAIKIAFESPYARIANPVAIHHAPG